LDNIEATITKPSYYYFDHIIREMKTKNMAVSDMKKEIEHYCLATPQSTLQTIFTGDAQEFG